MSCTQAKACGYRLAVSGPNGAGTLMTGRGAPLWAPEKAAAEGRPYRILRFFHNGNFLSMMIH